MQRARSINHTIPPLRGTHLSGRTRTMAEKAIRPLVREALLPFSTNCRRGDRLVHDLLAQSACEGKATNASAAASLLLVRASNDLRCMVNLSRSGYLLQAWALGTSLIEAAYSIGYIGDSESRATTWFAHEDFNKTPWNVRAAIKATITLLDLPVKNVDSLYRAFSQLSAAKHANPAILKRYGILAGSEGTLRIQLDPHFSSGILKLTVLGLAYATKAHCFGVWAFAKSHVVDTDVHQRVLVYAKRAPLNFAVHAAAETSPDSRAVPTAEEAAAAKAAVSGTAPS